MFFFSVRLHRLKFRVHESLRLFTENFTGNKIERRANPKGDLINKIVLSLKPLFIKETVMLLGISIK